ncbi:MAG: hypothetical protein IPM69_09030 [Ignavibacteria bacterium]|nr:hypothetical protein [Ignavibacteria bacterium]
METTMEIEPIKRLEHISLKSDLDLLAFGEKFETVLSLPKMEYDYENETEWLNIHVDRLSYNISRPYEEGTLQEWDDTTPEGCNIGIVLCIHNDHPLALDNDWVNKTVSTICELLSSTFNSKVYHHRTLILP